MKYCCNIKTEIFNNDITRRLSCFQLEEIAMQVPGKFNNQPRTIKF